MENFIKDFEDRVKDVETYIDLLTAIDRAIQQGGAHIDDLNGQSNYKISPEQERMLKSGTYLQLYNLVESTLSLCIQNLNQAMINGGSCKPTALNTKTRREWVRFIARTHHELNSDNRLDAMLNLVNHIVQDLPVTTFEIESSASGNWDDGVIDKFIERIGISFDTNHTAVKNVKRHFRNDTKPLTYIKNLRNWLAHGNISFAQTTENITVTELKNLKDRTVEYLRLVVNSFIIFIDSHEFLEPQHRPQKRK